MLRCAGSASYMRDSRRCERSFGLNAMFLCGTKLSALGAHKSTAPRITMVHSDVHESHQVDVDIPNNTGLDSIAHPRYVEYAWWHLLTFLV